jgi:hypothetical protein
VKRFVSSADTVIEGYPCANVGPTEEEILAISTQILAIRRLRPSRLQIRVAGGP